LDLFLQLLAFCQKSLVLAKDIIQRGIMMLAESNAVNSSMVVASAMPTSLKQEKSAKNFVSHRMT